ncbi:MAG: hypothetical protein D4R56_07580 [Deltaproteobacteria bacterium]|nr:MAG: hypothetical protein D4R56_07580 [Deltaproteobacteria bacterium]
MENSDSYPFSSHLFAKRVQVMGKQKCTTCRISGLFRNFNFPQRHPFQKQMMITNTQATTFAEKQLPILKALGIA